MINPDGLVFGKQLLTITAKIKLRKVLQVQVSDTTMLISIPNAGYKNLHIPPSRWFSSC
ncbi:MAG TPA: hypothetical protein VF610_07875 [Segetibacter sp.]